MGIYTRCKVENHEFPKRFAVVRKLFVDTRQPLKRLGIFRHTRFTGLKPRC